MAHNRRENTPGARPAPDFGKGQPDIPRARWRPPHRLSMLDGPATRRYFAIDGGMLDLASREDLERWRTNLYTREGTTTADFDDLKMYSKVLPRLGNGHATLDILEFHPQLIYPDVCCSSPMCLGRSRGREHPCAGIGAGTPKWLHE